VGIFFLALGLQRQTTNVSLSSALGHYLLLPPSAILDWFGSMGVIFSTPSCPASTVIFNIWNPELSAKNGI
jgi:hypothetical protein